jgi:hypothetical protein
MKFFWLNFRRVSQSVLNFSSRQGRLLPRRREPSNKSMASNRHETVRNSNEKPARSKPPKPKILLIDTRPEAEGLLKWDWSSVASGTFGPIYNCTRREDESLPVVLESRLPGDRSEAEIVAIDLTNVSLKPYPWPEDMAAFGSRDSWASCASGQIDPRPIAMSLVHVDFDRSCDSWRSFLRFRSPKASVEVHAWIQHFCLRRLLFSWLP